MVLTSLEKKEKENKQNCILGEKKKEVRLLINELLLKIRKSCKTTPSMNKSEKYERHLFFP